MVLIWGRNGGGGWGSSLKEYGQGGSVSGKEQGSRHKETLVTGFDWLRSDPKAVWERDPV